MTHFLHITEEAARLLRDEAEWFVERSLSREIAAAWYDGFIDTL